jgi:hypothetical protein
MIIEDVIIICMCTKKDPPQDESHEEEGNLLSLIASFSGLNVHDLSPIKTSQQFV